KTLGVLGLGRIGSEVARIGLAFGMEVIAWSQNLTPEKAQTCGARLVSREDLFRNADILTIHLVLSQRTRGLVGAAELRAMKPSARLINTSRGPIVDEPALIEVLRERRIAGAALDVFKIEPLPAEHPFRSLDNVLATPHIGFVARELYRTFYGDTVKNIMRWLAQQSPMEMASWLALPTKRRLSREPREASVAPRLKPLPGRGHTSSFTTAAQQRRRMHLSPGFARQADVRMQRRRTSRCRR